MTERLISPSPFQRGVRLLAVAALLLTSVSSGCGPGGGNDLSLSTTITGIVKESRATRQLSRKPGVLARLSAALFPSAEALTGMRGVGAGVLVQLYTIDNNGNRNSPILSQAVTVAGGRYTMQLPSWDLYDSNLPRVVAVGSAVNRTLMRRLVDDITTQTFDRDIDPASEAAVRILVGDLPGRPYSNVTPVEMAELNDLVASAVDPVGGLDIDEVNRVAELVAMNTEAVQRKLINITKSPSNIRPLALAGRDFRITTGQPLSLSANAEDQDGDSFPNNGFVWSVETRPAGSAINTTPPIGPDFQFQPDVDGSYVLKLVVQDSRLGISPPDFVTVVSTTPPVQLTRNNNVDSEGHMGLGRNWLVHTLVERDPNTNENYTNVYLQSMTDLAPIGCPWRVRAPGATNVLPNLRDTSLHGAIAANEAMMVMVIDATPTTPNEGGADFEVVAFPVQGTPACSPVNPLNPTAPRSLFSATTLWVTDNAVLDTQPDVQCSTLTDCVVLYINETIPGQDQLHFRTLSNPGTGFQVGVEQVYNDGLVGHSSPRLSQDGQWVVYVARDPVDGDLEIYRADLTNLALPPLQVTRNSLADEQLAIDATASRLLFRNSGSVWAIDIADVPQGMPIDPFTGLPIDTPKVRLSDSQLTAGEPSVTADGSLAAFVGDSGSGPELFTVLIDATAQTQLTSDGSVSQPQIALDGGRVLFRSARDGDHEFYLR